MAPATGTAITLRFTKRIWILGWWQESSAVPQKAGIAIVLAAAGRCGDSALERQARGGGVAPGQYPVGMPQ
ncbi:MAG TPA: hypothetical protein VFJ58_19475 [Armatimonadota bacterium]|nr:hypothetical protein [Armatimonadota bacterium]